MKVVIFNPDNHVVRQVHQQIYDPDVKRGEGKIIHSNGKIFGLNEEGKDFLIVEDHVPVEVGQIIDNSFKDYDRSHNYEAFSMEKVKEKVEEVGQELKEEIKEIFEGDEDHEKK